MSHIGRPFFGGMNMPPTASELINGTTHVDTSFSEGSSDDGSLPFVIFAWTVNLFVFFPLMLFVRLPADSSKTLY
jgi:hypothetical protein